MKFETTILQSGNNTGVVVPEEIVDALGAGKKPKVVVTINGFSYRNSIASMGGRFLISLSAANRAATGAAGGDVVEVELELDTAPREVEVPADLAEGLAANPVAQAAFDALSYSGKQRHILPIGDAKTEETRARRIAKTIETLAG